MARIFIEKNGRFGSYAGDLKIAHTWAAPSIITIPTIIGDFTVAVETTGKNWFGGDQPDWLLFQWALNAVEMVIGHESVFPGTIGPRGKQIPDVPNREERHARICSYTWERKSVRIEVPPGGAEGEREVYLERFLREVA